MAHNASEESPGTGGGASYDLLIWDLDGTLVDTVPDIADAVDRVLLARGLAPLGADRVRALVGEGARNLCERVMRARGLSVEAPALDEFLTAFRASYGAHLVAKSRVYEGIPAALAELGDVAMCVLTNKPGVFARPILAALELARFFRAIVGDGDGFARKPDPAAALALGRQCGVAADRMIVIGDALPDAELARALHVPFVGVGWGYGDPVSLGMSGARLVAGNTTELLIFIRSLLGPSARVR